MRLLLLLALAVSAAYCEDAAGTPVDVEAAASAAAVDDAAADEPAVAAAAADEEASDELPVAEEEEIEASADPASRAASGSASTQWVITAKMKAQLVELGYSLEEISQLDAERAAAVIRRSVARPTGGVPAAWNRGERRKANPIRSAVGAVGKTFSAVGLPSGAAGPILAAVAVGGLGALGVSIKGSSTTVKRALEPAAVIDDEPDDELIAPARDTSGELWLDVQIDRFIDFLKRTLLGKK